MSTGKIKIFTGSGKGKTPAALGAALQAAVNGQQVVIIEFLKGRDNEEHAFLERLEPEIKVFRFEKSPKDWVDMTEEERHDAKYNIQNGLHFAKKVLDTGECDLLIMDEVLGLIDNKIITVEELHDVVNLREDTDLILTGITMDDRVVAFADEISEINTVHFKNFEG